MNPGLRPQDLPVVILAGGLGSRMSELTQSVPKPMVYIGDKPILFHIILYYSAFGFRQFIICLGYKGHILKEYFENINRHNLDLTIRGGAYEYSRGSLPVNEWQFTLVETGHASLTATRILRAGPYIKSPNFCLTYGDGLCDVRLDKELEFHAKHGKIGTVVGVHQPPRFGNLELAPNGTVTSFREKNRGQHDYINGGFFVFRREFLDRLSPAKNEPLEGEPLSRLANDGELMCFQHDGFWQCMDTVRDRDLLEKLYNEGHAPWIR